MATASTTVFGQLGWSLNHDVGSGSVVPISGEADHQGIVRITAGTSVNDAESIRGAVSYFPYDRPDLTTGQYGFLVRVNDTANSEPFIGFSNGGTGIYVYSTTGGNWKAEACSSCSFAAGADTGVAPTATAWTYVLFGFTGSGATVSINGGAPTAFTGTFPTTALRAVVGIRTKVAGSNHSIDIDAFVIDRPFGARY
jgi:hypothetical protein